MNIRFSLYFGQNKQLLRQVRQATLPIIPGDGAYRYTDISYVVETNAFAVALSWTKLKGNFKNQLS